MCYSLAEVAEEHAVVDYLVEIVVVDDDVHFVVVILLLDVVAKKEVDDPIPNLLRWDDVVQASGDVVAGLATVDVYAVVVVVLVSFLSNVAVVFADEVDLLCLVDADEKFYVVDVSLVADLST